LFNQSTLTKTTNKNNI